jgi:hypothetical protein
MATAMEPPTAPWQAQRRALLAAGFCDEADRLRRGLLAARLERDWLIFEIAAGAATRHLGLLSLGQPGLWKPSTAGDFVFELPASLLAMAQDELGDDDGLEAEGSVTALLADWAMITLDPAASTDWHAPDEALVRSWLPSESMVIQQGPLLRKFDLVCQPGRFALRSVLVAEVSAALSTARRAWIEKTLAAAQAQWRMARFGFGGIVGQPTIEVEVDLSVCPKALARELLHTARSVLEVVIRHLLPTLDILCDPAVHCETWETLF